MKRKDYWLMLSLAVMAGLVGGLVSDRVFRGEIAFAEKAPAHAKVLTAEKFVLVDKNGRVHAALGSWGKPPSYEWPALRFFNEDDEALIRLSISDGSPTLLLSSRNGKARVMLNALNTGCLILTGTAGDTMLDASFGLTFAMKDNKTTVVVDDLIIEDFYQLIEANSLQIKLITRALSKPVSQ